MREPLAAVPLWYGLEIILSESGRKFSEVMTSGLTILPSAL
jgi:hypothetical protein